MAERVIRVLVADDTAHVRKMLTTMLEADGFSVVGSVSNGADVVTAAVALAPDVVVVDYRMPGMDGLETARLLKQQRPDQHVIVYTAFVEHEVEAAAAEIGVALCVSKVEGIPALEQEIRRLVH